ncbi:MAG TPA: glycosyltransferase family 4 protein [Gemmatimonadaceae bacterium]|nr:glycosyltransferase family 4 protein [Gemmatimonadaceae bacterium]
MKVLMTADTVGGVWTYAMELAAALRPLGVRIVLATMGAPMDAAQRAEAAARPNLLVHESRYRLEWMDAPWEDVDRAGAWLLALERAERPDVVHLNGYAHADLPWLAPVMVAGHSCVRSWWESVRGTPAPESWNEYTTRVRAGLRAAEIVVAPSHAMLAALEKHYGPLDRTRVIPNGRSPALFSPAAKEPLIMAAGRLWDEAKNLAVLDRIAGELPWPVYVAGDAESPDRRGERLRAVRALGRLDGPTLAYWLGRASIYALPARYEPFGLSVVEAALSGCALVLGDIPSLREIWGDAATFVAPDDAAALTRAIRWLCDDASLRRAQGARARLRALALAPACMAARYLAIYQMLAQDALRRSAEVACAS